MPSTLSMVGSMFSFLLKLGVVYSRSMSSRKLCVKKVECLKVTIRTHLKHPEHPFFASAIMYLICFYVLLNFVKLSMCVVLKLFRTPPDFMSFELFIYFSQPKQSSTNPIIRFLGHLPSKCLFRGFKPLKLQASVRSIVIPLNKLFE